MFIYRIEARAHVWETYTTYTYTHKPQRKKILLRTVCRVPRAKNGRATAGRQVLRPRTPKLPASLPGAQSWV